MNFLSKNKIIISSTSLYYKMIMTSITYIYAINQYLNPFPLNQYFVKYLIFEKVSFKLSPN